MKQISILGAGRSAGFLISYLGNCANREGWKLRVCDTDFMRLKASFEISSHTELSIVDLSVPSELSRIVSDSFLVVSVLPPILHVEVAKICLVYGVHLFTASYTSAQMLSLDAEATAKGLLFMNELGLDPGIDHLSASRLFDKAQSEGLDVVEFESHCGGLVSEDSCGNNPWKYKFTWNPSNVVLAGQGDSCIWKENGNIKRLDAQRVFAESRKISVPGLGIFDVYANRNSLTYQELYGLNNAKTLLRGTLRRENYCKAWSVLIDWGFANSKDCVPPQVNTRKEWFQWLTGAKNFSQWTIQLLRDNPHLDNIIGHLHYLELDSSSAGESISGLNSARILENILLDKWQLQANDIDEVVMVHKLVLRDLNGKPKQWYSVLRVLGEGGDRTAMAKTVGFPLAMGVETFLMGELTDRGVMVPFDKSWYRPILDKLALQKIVFEEHFS